MMEIRQVIILWKGTLSFADNITNPKNLTASVKVTVAKKAEEPKPEPKKEIKSIVNAKLDDISVKKELLQPLSDFRDRLK